jgi:hypothetical protein
MSCVHIHRLNPSAMKRVMEQLLQTHLENKTYSVEDAAETTKLLADEIKNNLRGYTRHLCNRKFNYSCALSDVYEHTPGHKVIKGVA